MAKRRRFYYWEKVNRYWGRRQPTLSTRQPHNLFQFVMNNMEVSSPPNISFSLGVLVLPHPSSGAVLWGRGWQGEVSPKLSGEQRDLCDEAKLPVVWSEDQRPQTEGAQVEQVGLGVAEQRARVSAEVEHEDRSVLESTRDKHTQPLMELAAEPVDSIPPSAHSTFHVFVCTVPFWNAPSAPRG